MAWCGVDGCILKPIVPSESESFEDLVKDLGPLGVFCIIYRHFEYLYRAPRVQVLSEKDLRRKARDIDGRPLVQEEQIQLCERYPVCCPLLKKRNDKSQHREILNGFQVAVRGGDGFVRVYPRTSTASLAGKLGKLGLERALAAVLPRSDPDQTPPRGSKRRRRAE